MKELKEQKGATFWLEGNELCGFLGLCEILKFMESMRGKWPPKIQGWSWIKAKCFLESTLNFDKLINSETFQKFRWICMPTIATNWFGADLMTSYEYLTVNLKAGLQPLVEAACRILFFPTNRSCQPYIWANCRPKAKVVKNPSKMLDCSGLWNIKNYICINYICI